MLMRMGGQVSQRRGRKAEQRERARLKYLFSVGGRGGGDICAPPTSKFQFCLSTFDAEFLARAAETSRTMPENLPTAKFHAARFVAPDISGNVYF